MSRFMSIVAGPPSQAQDKVVDLRYIVQDMKNDTESYYVANAIDRGRTIDRDITWLKATRTNDGRHAVFLRQHRTSSHRILVFEAPVLTLRDVANNDEMWPLSIGHVKEISEQIIRGVAALHVEMVSHTDIKPENVEFLDGRTHSISVYAGGNTFEPKKILICTSLRVSFYGCAGVGSSLELGTDQYKAPELVYGWPRRKESDCFSIGCVVGEMLVGRALFNECPPNEDYIRCKTLMYMAFLSPDDNEFQIHVKSEFPYICHQLDLLANQKIMQLPRFARAYVGICEELRESLDHDEEGAHLVARLMHPIPDRRLSLIDALRHPFFALRNDMMV